jgi:hypothetical protein
LSGNITEIDWTCHNETIAVSDIVKQLINVILDAAAAKGLVFKAAQLASKARTASAKVVVIDMDRLDFCFRVC